MSNPQQTSKSDNPHTNRLESVTIDPFERVTKCKVQTNKVLREPLNPHSDFTWDETGQCGSEMHIKNDSHKSLYLCLDCLTIFRRWHKDEELGTYKKAVAFQAVNLALPIHDAE